MKRLTVFRFDVPYREQLHIEGFYFGEQREAPDCAIVGQMRGDEAQQAYTCSCVVERLERLEEQGKIRKGASILVIPCANPFSMNVTSRFWSSDGTDINRRFPGNPQGETTERVAAGIFGAVRGSVLGIQFASFNQQGDFLPHVRVTRAGAVSDESLAMAEDFHLPCVVSREATPFDTGTLNYRWREAGTHAFSLYTRTTDRIDRPSATMVENAVVRFLSHAGLVTGSASAGVASTRIDEAELVDIRTDRQSGFLDGLVKPGDAVEKGQELGLVRGVFDASVRERLTAPVAGRIFFCRTKPLIQQHMVAYRIVPERG
jgi:predicted deacylase